MLPTKILFPLLTTVAALNLSPDDHATQGDATTFLADLETYFIRAYVLDMTLVQFNGTEEEAADIAGAMEDLGAARLRLESDANTMTSLSGYNSRAITKELVSHTDLDTSYLGQLQSKKDLFVGINRGNTTAGFLLSTNRTVSTLLPVIKAKVDEDDGVAVTVMQCYLLKKIQAAIDVYEGFF